MCVSLISFLTAVSGLEMKDGKKIAITWRQTARSQLAQIKDHCKDTDDSVHRSAAQRLCLISTFKLGRLLSCVIVQRLMRFPSKSYTFKHIVQTAQMLGYEKSVRHMQVLPHSYAKRAKVEFMMYAASFSDSTMCINHA